jgi:hypothetical protein
MHNVPEQLSSGETATMLELLDGLFQKPLTEYKPGVYASHLGRPTFFPLVAGTFPKTSVLLDHRCILLKPRLERVCALRSLVGLGRLDHSIENGFKIRRSFVLEHARLECTERPQRRVEIELNVG